MPLLGKAAMLLSFDVAQEAIAEHDECHTHDHLPDRLSIPGFLSMMPHWLEGALTPQMTNEQRIRGVDGGVDWALLTTGYSQDTLAALAQGDLCSERFEAHGAAGVVAALYRTDYTLTSSEIGARPQ